MPSELSGRTALITGVSAGMGAALAVTLTEHGVTVGLWARRADRRAQVLGQCRSRAPDSAMLTLRLLPHLFEQPRAHIVNLSR